MCHPVAFVSITLKSCTVLDTDLGWSESWVHMFRPQDILNQAVRRPAPKPTAVTATVEPVLVHLVSIKGRSVVPALINAFLMQLMAPRMLPRKIQVHVSVEIHAVFVLPTQQPSTAAHHAVLTCHLHRNLWHKSVEG
jgi:hypothetical protein